MSRQHPLMLALEELKTIPFGNSAQLGKVIKACTDAPDDLHYTHVLYAEISEILIKHQHWKSAEYFSVKSLICLPSGGYALSLLASSLAGQNLRDEANACERYSLPIYIQDKYFKPECSLKILSERSSNVTKYPAHPAQRIDLKKPISLSCAANSIFSLKNINAPAADTYKLNNSRVWFDGFNTIVWDSDECIVEDISRGFSDVVNCTIKRHEITVLKGTACVLGNRNASNYYHWFNDVLPRIHVLTTSGVNLSDIDHFICNSLEFSFQYESLSVLGVDISKLVFADSFHYFSCESLYIALYGSNTLGKSQAKWNPMFLKTSFLYGTDISSKCLTSKYIYITRKNAIGRNVENEKELLSFLNRYNFTSVTLEDLSIRDQAIIFNNASVIVGPHGAGFTNLVFCNPNTTVVELYRDHILPCFWLISEMIGLRHATMYCSEFHSVNQQKSTTDRTHSLEKKRKSNFFVNVDKLASLFAVLGIS